MQEEILGKVQARFPDAQINVELDGNRAQITVISDVFADMSRVKKQQAVYAAISDYIADGRLHAVTIDARTVSG
ncbi:MAG: BolA/IbaG family iron-sulfur metabolism protein [Pseudomonadales bacterium]